MTTMCKFVEPRPFAEPSRRRTGRIFIELINGPFLFEHRGSPVEYGAGVKLAIERRWAFGSTRAAPM
jgi:hypothetical protein